MKTRITEAFGIEYPIFQGGMAWISDGKLAAAVSNGGGLGIISAMNANAEYLKKQIDLARSLTDKPFETILSASLITMSLDARPRSALACPLEILP